MGNLRGMIDDQGSELERSGANWSDLGQAPAISRAMAAGIDPVEPNSGAAACDCGWLFFWSDAGDRLRCCRCQSPPVPQMVRDIFAAIRKLHYADGRPVLGTPGWQRVTDFVRPNWREVFPQLAAERDASTAADAKGF